MINRGKKKVKDIAFPNKGKKQTTCALPQFGYSKSIFEYVAHEDLNETEKSVAIYLNDRIN